MLQGPPIFYIKMAFVFSGRNQAQELKNLLQQPTFELEIIFCLPEDGGIC